LLPLLLFACAESPPPWHGTDIRGVMPDLAFHLTDEHGRPVGAANYAGKLRLVYFGFSHCDDVCPATLHTLTEAIARLGAEAGRVRVLFVSVDPRRDTPAVLARYAHHFGPQVVGLTGSQAQLRALAKRYRVSFSYGKPDAKGDYEVYHSSAVFTFDGRGRARLLVGQKEGAATIAADLKRLLANAS
jgi:protein SCO1/2